MSINQPGRILHQRATLGSLESHPIDRLLSRLSSLAGAPTATAPPLPHKQQRQVPAHQWSCPVVKRSHPRWLMEDGASSVPSIQPTPTRGPHPLWHLLAQQTCAEQRRLAARQIMVAESKRECAPKTDGWTDRPCRNPTKQHETRTPSQQQQQQQHRSILHVHQSPSPSLQRVDPVELVLCASICVGALWNPNQKCLSSALSDLSRPCNQQQQQKQQQQLT